MDADQDLLFAGLKVLDVGSWIAGPVAGTILADFGADVIKVELPGIGDAYRQLSALPMFPDADENYMWQMDARNKRSLSLNLKSATGMNILHELVRQCDVYITNNPLPMRRALKLEYEDLKPLNEAMIYASLTSYGENGPEKDREAFDLVAYWARTGLMDLVRTGDAPPAQALPGMGDHPSAVALYAAIVTALLKRERTGKGSMVHTSLLGNGLWSASCIAQAVFADGSLDNFRAARQLPVFSRNLYETSDLRWLQFTMVRTEEEFAHLLHAVGLSGLLEDERFATPEARAVNSGLLITLFSDLIRERTSDQWLEIFHAEGVNVTRMGVIEELVGFEQISANNMVVPPKDERINMPYVIDHPVGIAGLAKVGPKKAPELGEHNTEILTDLGYSAAQIDQLRADGVI